jgi:hypothetical protein
MTSGRPGLAASLRSTRDRLLGLGLAEDQVVTTGALGAPRFHLTDLDVSAYGVEFASLAQRLQRVLSGARGASIYVTGRRNDPGARTHTALQLALALGAHGREIVLVDADFLRPGLGGLIEDPEAEGVLDMVRFGRSTRSLLLRPVPGGPAFLPAGSFPMEDPSPFELDALRSVAYRVSQVCDLALYVGPLPIRAGLHPLARVCDHVVYAAGDAESDGAGELFESLGDLQRQSAHVLGVVLYAAAAATPPAVEARPAAAVAESAEAAPPLVPPDWAAVTLPSEAAPPARPAPITDWSRFDQETPAARPAPPGGLEPHPPDEARPPWSYEPGRSQDLVGAGEPTSAPAGPLALPHVPPTTPARPPRVELEKPVLGASRYRTARDGEADDKREYAFEADAKDSRWPVLLVVTLVVLIVGFVGWTLWNVRQARQLEQASAPAAPPNDADAAGRAQPDDAAATGEAPTAGATGEPAGAAPAPAGATQPPAAVTEPGATKPPAPAPAEPGVTATPPAPAPVEPKATPPVAADKPPAAAATGGALYAVHVASFKTTALADKEIASLVKRGYQARAIETDLGSKGVWYRVYVGSFSSVAEANAARDVILTIPGYDFAQVRRLPR